MSKIDIINDCGDCSNSKYRGNYWLCGKTEEVVEENGIPSTCPLPDFTEPGVEADAETPCPLCEMMLRPDHNVRYCFRCGRNLRTP